MDKACVLLALFTLLWIAAAIVALIGVFYQSRARRYYRPPSLMARLSPVARFRSGNYAPEAAMLVSRGRIAAFVFLGIVVGGLALGRLGIGAGATGCA